MWSKPSKSFYCTYSAVLPKSLKIDFFLCSPVVEDSQPAIYWTNSLAYILGINAYLNFEVCHSVLYATCANTPLLDDSLSTPPNTSLFRWLLDTDIRPWPLNRMQTFWIGSHMHRLYFYIPCHHGITTPAPWTHYFHQSNSILTFVVISHQPLK
jgi:hypothetical protein